MFTQQAAALPLKKRARKGRRLVAVDIENVVGGAVTTLAEARRAKATITAAIALEPDEQVVIGVSHISFLCTKTVWPSACVKVRSGENGADQELICALGAARIEERFDELVLVSGDGIFTDTVARLGGLGVEVTVASWDASLATRLRLAAKCTIPLDGLYRWEPYEVSA